MKMNEEEGPGEYDHTEELVKAWKVAVLGNLQMQHSRVKQKTRLPKFTVNISQNITIFKTMTLICWFGSVEKCWNQYCDNLLLL